MVELEFTKHAGNRSWLLVDILKTSKAFLTRTDIPDKSKGESKSIDHKWTYSFVSSLGSNSWKRAFLGNALVCLLVETRCSNLHIELH